MGVEQGRSRRAVTSVVLRFEVYRELERVVLLKASGEVEPLEERHLQCCTCEGECVHVF